MIQYVLACMIWAKPELKPIKVNVDEFGMAYVIETRGDYTFEVSVVEERMNYMKITHNPANISTQSNMPSYIEKSMTLRLSVGSEQSSLDCEIK